MWRSRLSSRRAVKVAIAPFLRAYPCVTTLGIQPSIADYADSEQRLLRDAECIFFPTQRFVDIFEAAGKATFPRATTYRYQRSRSLQQSLFHYLRIPCPHTRVYYGSHQKREILKDFSIPLWLMNLNPLKGQPRLVTSAVDLDFWAERCNPVIIREVLPLTERFCLIAVQQRCIAALRLPADLSERTGAEPADLAAATLQAIWVATGRLLRTALLDDIAVEWGFANGHWQVLGLDRPPPRVPTGSGMLHRHHYIGGLIQAGML
jgi:hypothetical protein